MPSIVHGPGKREGMAVQAARSPSRTWEILAREMVGMTAEMRRRIAMLQLHIVCEWTMADLGSLFNLHKGHVCREIQKARVELHDKLTAAGLDLVQSTPEELGRAEVIYVRLTSEEATAFRAHVRRNGVSDSKQARAWILAGGLSDVMDRMEPGDALPTSEV